MFNKDGSKEKTHIIFDVKKNLSNLNWLANIIFDTVSLDIPVSPKFCVNSAGDIKIFAEETISRQLMSDRNYQDTLKSIDESGFTGIGYILKNLPINRSEHLIVFDKILAKWSDSLTINPLNCTDYYLQLTLFNHERLLSDIDNFFEKQIKNVVSENKNRELSVVRDPRLPKKELILDVEKIKKESFIKAKTSIKSQSTTSLLWIKLLNFTTDNPDCAITEHEFETLINYYVDKMQDNNWQIIKRDSLGFLSQHLQVRREGQNELRFNAEGSLRTSGINSVESHILTSTEIRDPISRNHYIDTTTIEDAQDFRDIIIAANLRIRDGYDKASVKEKLNTRKNLRDRLVSNRRLAKIEKVEYYPTAEELEAMQLEDIDCFVESNSSGDNNDFLPAIMLKLDRFLAGERLSLSELQFTTLHTYNFPSLQPMSNKKNPKRKSDMHCSSLESFGFLRNKQEPGKNKKQKHIQETDYNSHQVSL